MTERDLYEDAIYRDLKTAEETLDKMKRRIGLLRDRMEKEAEGSARLVPEDKTLKQDLFELASQAKSLSDNLDASVQDYQNLIDVIELNREEEVEAE